MSLQLALLNVCRVCLSTQNNMNSLFIQYQFCDELKEIGDVLMNLTSIQSYKNDGLPNKICENCLSEVTRLFRFKKLYENSDVYLRNALRYNTEMGPTSLNESALKETTDCNNFYGNNIQYLCKFCNTVFADSEGFRHHLQAAHQIHNCSQCDASFTMHELLLAHSRIHQQEHILNVKSDDNKTNNDFPVESNEESISSTIEKSFLCTVCGKRFAQASYLKYHSFTHTGEKPYECAVCNKRFATPGGLSAHRKFHTGKRPYMCKICGKSYPRAGYLVVHNRIHANDRPLECKVCQKKFLTNTRLVEHMRIHSGEKPYACTDCDKSFAIKGTLNRHMRIHRGEKPYACNVCNNTFTQAATLKTHMKVHKAN